jgi:osmotically-inducible protein OsmY
MPFWLKPSHWADPSDQAQGHEPTKRLTTLGAPRGTRRCQLLSLLILGVSLLLAGCAPLLVGGAAVGAASTIHDRRPASVILDDHQIELSAMSALLRDAKVRDGGRVSATSYNRTVLLTGQVRTPEIRQQATSLISRLPKVRRVVDELAIGPPISLTRQSEDTYVTAKVKTALLDIDIPGFDPTRVKIVTENGTVYLMGLLTPREAAAATDKARYVPGVARVVKLFDDLNADD